MEFVCRAWRGEVEEAGMAGVHSERVIAPPLKTACPFLGGRMDWPYVYCRKDSWF